MKRRWPRDFTDFQGDFSAFAEACRDATESVLGDKGPSDGLVRHYQQNGSVSRGARSGRAATYGFHEIAEVVATKALVSQGWSVKHAAEVIPTLDQQKLLTMIDQGQPPVAPTSQGSTAMALVDSLLHKARGAPPASQRPLPVAMVASSMASATMGGGLAFAASQNMMDTTRPSLRASLDPTPWMQVLVEPTALQSLTPTDIEDGLDVLRQQLAALNPGKDTP